MKSILRENLPSVIAKVNDALRGRKIGKLEPVLNRVGRGGALPHWYEGLRDFQALPNLDGKTVGSVVEMLLVAVLETHTYAKHLIPKLKINAAKGVDLPDLGIGVKSPSKNFCTSEPFYSAYERLLGGEHDCLILLTDYQDAKKIKPFRIQIIDSKYLTRTQIADRTLCRIARKHRALLLADEESRAKRVFRFLAFVNQADWRAKRLLTMLDHFDSDTNMQRIALQSKADFAKTNAQRLKKDKMLLPDDELKAILNILELNKTGIGLIDALDNWVVESSKDTARSPSDHEWKCLKDSPLNGMIGMSLALQWRYNFGSLFGAKTIDTDGES